MIENKAIATLRVLSMEEITKAKSGHPGIALGAATILHTLYKHFLKVDPTNPNWINRDRFVLAAGHASSLLYSMLHLAGFNVTTSDLASFRQLHSKTPGHPEIGVTDGVDASSGPLGQGVPTAVGMAIAEAHLHAKFPKVIDHYTYVLCSDGELQEGICQEGFSLAGHLGLNKLIVIYDSNDIQLDGRTDASYSDNAGLRMKSLGWNYILVKDGDCVEELKKAIKKAKNSDKPTLIEARTIIGKTCSLAGSHECHGKPLSQEEVSKMREALGGEIFTVSDDVKDFYSTIKKNGKKNYKKWQQEIKDIDTTLVDKMFNDSIDVCYDSLLSKEDYKNEATRASGGKILKALNDKNPMIIGGSADLVNSTLAKGADGTFSKDNRLGRNIAFGVREHAMAAISNGIALHKGLRPFCSGFFVFSDYCKPAMRLAAIQKLPVTYIFTHDSIAVGEDGCTHEPIEQLASLRSIPNFNVIRPADINECLEAYSIAFNSKETPTALILTRQNVEALNIKTNVIKGAYVVKDMPNFTGIIIATGSEVSLALKVQEELAKENINVRVVSMPSLFLFDKESKEYKEEVLPTNIRKRMAIEMGEASHLYKYVGLDGTLYNITNFGASGKANEVIEEYGFTVDAIVKKYKEL